MTTTGYRLMLALFAILALAGAIAAAPMPAELGLAPSMSCADWFAEPRETDLVRLEGCTVDLWTNSYDESLDGRGITSAVVQVRPPGWQPDAETEGDPALLLWRTTDPEILSLVDRGRRAPDDAAYERFAERYGEELLRAQPVVGSIARRSDEGWIEHVDLHGESVVERPWTADEGTRSPALRAAGLLGLTLGLFWLALLVGLQRAWLRRRGALLGISTGPKRF